MGPGRLKTSARQNGGVAVSSAADEFVVDGQLAEWLDRHGMHAQAGDKVRLELVQDSGTAADITKDEVWGAFIGRFESPEPDLASRAKEIVRDEMGTQSEWPCR